MSFEVHEIHQVDQFIKAGLVSVPAFKIGEKVILHPHDGPLEETIDKVMDFLRGEKTYLQDKSPGT